MKFRRRKIFPPKLNSKVSKTSETKKMRIEMFKCFKYMLFSKKNQFNIAINVKNCLKYTIYTDFYVFHPVDLNFFEK